MRTKLLITVIAAAAVLTACGGDAPSSSAGGDTSGGVSLGAPIAGGGLTVDEALTTDATGPLAVHGLLIDSGSGVRLCAAILESFPPQCGGASLDVVGVTVADQPGAQTANSVTWVEDASLTGDLDGQTFTVSGTTN